MLVLNSREPVDVETVETAPLTVPGGIEAVVPIDPPELGAGVPRLFWRAETTSGANFSKPTDWSTK